MSYRGFNSLLQKLADEAEITLRDTERHAINVSSECVDEPLLLLLNGFDEYGGGEIASTACLQLSRRLRYIADKWADRCHKYHDWHDECASLAHAIGEAAFLGEKFYWF